MREEKINKIEVHVAPICFNNDLVLCLKRSPERKIFPNLWECGGGAVWPGENFEEAAERELRDEAGIAIKPLKIFTTYEIFTPDLDQRKIPGIRMVCHFLKYLNGERYLSKEHTEYRWQKTSELDKIEFVPGLKDAILEGYEIYKSQGTFV